MIFRTVTPTDYSKLSQVMKAAYAEAPWNENWSDERAILAEMCVINREL